MYWGDPFTYLIHIPDYMTQVHYGPSSIVHRGVTMYPQYSLAVIIGQQLGRRRKVAENIISDPVQIPIRGMHEMKHHCALVLTL